METIVMALQRWLEQNGLPLDGVELVIKFPSKFELYNAQACMLENLSQVVLAPHRRAPLPVGDVEIYNIPVRFEC